jgi:hypothetical protein
VDDREPADDERRAGQRGARHRLEQQPGRRGAVHVDGAERPARGAALAAVGGGVVAAHLRADSTPGSGRSAAARSRQGVRLVSRFDATSGRGAGARYSPARNALLGQRGLHRRRRRGVAGPGQRARRRDVARSRLHRVLQPRRPQGGRLHRPVARPLHARAGATGTSSRRGTPPRPPRAARPPTRPTTTRRRARGAITWPTCKATSGSGC